MNQGFLCEKRVFKQLSNDRKIAPFPLVRLDLLLNTMPQQVKITSVEE